MWWTRYFLCTSNSRILWFTILCVALEICSVNISSPLFSEKCSGERLWMSLLLGVRVFRWPDTARISCWFSLNMASPQLTLQCGFCGRVFYNKYILKINNDSAHRGAHLNKIYLFKLQREGECWFAQRLHSSPECAFKTAVSQQGFCLHFECRTLATKPAST